MLTARTLLLLCCSGLVLTAFRSNDPLPIGSSLPHKTRALQDVSGKTITLQDKMGRNGLLVMFSCNTCPVVIDNQQRTAEICRYASSRDIGVVLLNSNEGNRGSSESLEKMKAYAQAQGYAWPYAEDKNNVLADAFGATKTPECFLFDAQGKLIYHGAIDDNPQNESAVKRLHLKEAIDESVSGKDITVKVTRSVGCSIKRLAAN